MNYLIPPFHIGNGQDGNTFTIFTTESLFRYDIIIIQNIELYVQSAKHINDGDFIEDYYEVEVTLINNDVISIFKMNDLNNLLIYGLRNFI